MTYEINLNTITDELVETYNRLLHNDVCIADAYRDQATENFEGTVGLFVLTGRIEDNEEAFEYIETLKDKFNYCRKCFEESYELETKNMMCDYGGVCAGMSCPMYWKCQHWLQDTHTTYITRVEMPLLFFYHWGSSYNFIPTTIK